MQSSCLMERNRQWNLILIPHFRAMVFFMFCFEFNSITNPSVLFGSLLLASSARAKLSTQAWRIANAWLALTIEFAFACQNWTTVRRASAAATQQKIRQLRRTRSSLNNFSRFRCASMFLDPFGKCWHSKRWRDKFRNNKIPTEKGKTYQESKKRQRR